MKKIIVGIILLLFVFIFFASTSVFAGAKNASQYKWTWKGDKSAYFMKTGSGLVQGWTYDHPDMGNAKWIFIPKSKFKNAEQAGCDEGWLKENLNWNPHNLHNVLDNNEGYWEIFKRNEGYVFCAYPME